MSESGISADFHIYLNGVGTDMKSHLENDNQFLEDGNYLVNFGVEPLMLAKLHIKNYEKNIYAILPFLKNNIMSELALQQTMKSVIPKELSAFKSTPISFEDTFIHKYKWDLGLNETESRLSPRKCG